ncbi:MAG TPA: hypothetical protein VHF28_00065 [Nitrososphaera sp.]|nr:hypothetical protein [Nitrososphaera sp.]
MGQIYNVLIILAITLLMAVTTTVLAYFVDLLPQAVDNNNLAQRGLSNNASSFIGDGASQDN